MMAAPKFRLTGQPTHAQDLAWIAAGSMNHLLPELVEVEGVEPECPARRLERPKRFLPRQRPERQFLPWIPQQFPKVAHLASRSHSRDQACVWDEIEFLQKPVYPGFHAFQERHAEQCNDCELMPPAAW